MSIKGVNAVAVIDDSEDIRCTISEELREASFDPKPLDGPFSNVSELVAAARSEADAAVCDHHLSTRNYAYCSGAEAVANLYDYRFPAVLVTSWSRAQIDDMRRFRRKIPILINHDDVDIDPDIIGRGFEVCMEEFKDNYIPRRRPWKTLIRIEEVDVEQKVPIVYSIIPSWSSTDVIRFPIDIIRTDLQVHVVSGARFFAKVNTGAEVDDEIYLDDFEFRG